MGRGFARCVMTILSFALLASACSKGSDAIGGSSTPYVRVNPSSLLTAIEDELTEVTVPNCDASVW